MRRAMRNARMIGTADPYLYKLTGFVAEHMRDAYPEMMESVQRVARVVKDEEHRYATTFQVAEKVLPRRGEIGGGRRAPRRRRVQALRYLRPRARRAGGYGARIRPDHRSRGLRRGDGEAAHPRSRELERRGEGAGQSGLSGVAANRICRAGRRWKLARDGASAAARWTKSRSIERRSTPRRADRSAIPACWCRRKPARRSRSWNRHTRPRPERRFIK